MLQLLEDEDRERNYFRVVNDNERVTIFSLLGYCVIMNLQCQVFQHPPHLPTAQLV